jgi:hypothetical protein
MPIAEMAESRTVEKREPGAPMPPDAVDPELVKLSRTKLKIGIVTAAGVFALSVYFLIRLGADREYARASETPRPVALGDVVAGNVDTNSYIQLDAEPLMSHAMRTGVNQGDIGLRVVPVRGTSDKLWLVLDGDGWVAPATKGYAGRLRKLSDLPFAGDLRDFVADRARPLFTTAAGLRSGQASGKLAAVSGDTIEATDGDRVSFDVVVPDLATIVASFNDRLPDVATWQAALSKAGITPTKVGEPDMFQRNVRFDVAIPVADATAKLATAELFATRVDSVTRHYETTWGTVKSSPAGAITVDAKTSVPDAQLDVVGFYVKRSIPDDAYAVITNEKPEDYWYVMPITIALAAIGFVFAWALVRAIRRDLLPART